MALQSETRGYKGRGRFTLKPIGGGRPFDLGNVAAFNETIEVDRQSRADYKTAAGGELDVDERVEAYTFEAVINDITPQNIAAGFLAGMEHLGAQSITGEQLVAWTGARAGFRYLPDPSQPVTVGIDGGDIWSAETEFALGQIHVDGTDAFIVTTAGTSGTIEPSWDTESPVTDGSVVWTYIGKSELVASVDYERTPHGIRLVDEPANLVAGADDAVALVVSYERNPQYLLQALSSTQTLYELRWEGLNAVDNGNPMSAVYFRVKLSPTSGFQRHGGDDFAELTLTGTVLKDDSRTGTGLSQFAEMVMI